MKMLPEEIGRIERGMKKRVVVLYKGEIENEEIEEFDGIDLTGREELFEVFQELYKVEEIPSILAYGELFSLGEIEKVKKKKEEHEKRELEEAIKLVKEEKRVIFIKGTPSRPECKFTREFVEILKEEGLKEGDYKSINILESPSVREGMKKFGDWPTYPQIYIGGVLAGGLDVIKAERKRGNIRRVLGVE